MSAAQQVQVTFDCADPRALSLFWNEVLGYELPPPPPGFDSWDAFAETLPPDLRNSASASQDPGGVGPRLFFQRVPEGTRSLVETPNGPELVSVKNKVHLDVRAAPELQGDERMAALEAECDRLNALGATRVERHEPAPPMASGHIVMRDPEGNVFCLD